MISIYIDNSECRVEGLNTQQHRELKELLSYTLNPNARFFGGGYGPKKQSLLTKTGTFPTGLLYVVNDYLKSINQPFSKHDLRRVPMPLESPLIASLGFAPYPEQIEAARAAKCAGRGIVVAPTGVGKSLICTLIIQELNVRTLVIVPSLELKRQLTESLQAAFGTVAVGKGKTIYVENIDSVKEADVYGRYDAVIIDEFHHSGAKTYRKLNKKALSSTYYKIGLTATPFRSQDNEKLLLESVLAEVIYRIEYQEAVAAGYIVPLEAYYIEIPATIPKDTYNSTSWASVYSALIVNNDSRNQIIANLLLRLNANNISTLCLVKEIKHGESISTLSNCFFANGESEDTPHLIKLFNKSRLSVLIGTTGVLGEGVDTKPCEYVVIAGLGKSKNSIMQQVGRSFRRYLGKEAAKVILILDRSHKWTREHFRAQCKILLDEYNIVPTKIDID